MKLTFLGAAHEVTGSSTLLTANGRTYLIDCGMEQGRDIYENQPLPMAPGELDGILLTHEHSDHIKGLGVLSRKYGVPIYTTPGTAEAVKAMTNLGKIDGELFREIHADEDFILGDLTISPFRISHDAAEPVAYRVACGEKKMAVATDLGVYTDYTIDHLKDLDVLLLEANHDIHMLQVGAYPYYLKQRIAGDRGHLSNESAGKLLGQVLHDNMKAVFLGHLSKENNYAELAYETVKLELMLNESPYKPGDFPMWVASRDEQSECVAV